MYSLRSTRICLELNSQTANIYVLRGEEEEEEEEFETKLKRSNQ